MEDANIIYRTNLGFSFNWKRSPAQHINKVHLVIKDVALLLTKEELIKFTNYIDAALNRKEDETFSPNPKQCLKSILLETPVSDVTFIKSYKEILVIKELVHGTLFELGLSSLLKKIL
ncbi:hypothetical protein [Seonamhaeicola marinus]|uniref:Uncharacterized protein n=1 Tax=Seonamhaeicola marinus TaxID=1912246 RepID=A0A5D0HJK5_9FLAO|nr:hypothetical protein [Seonamhaeicola marinus]TYA71468.1 hypothetical protein FUA24_17965 [Seonamhaeicola marinus]